MMDTLLNFSGGLDSAYCLYDYLTNNDTKLLVHHIDMPNPNHNRNVLENRAVDNILDWCLAQGLDNFEFRQSVFDIGNSSNRFFDAYVVAFYTAAVLRDKRYKGVTKYISCLPKDERERLGDELERRWKVAASIRDPLLERKLEVIYPMAHMSKREVIKAMPKELVDMTVSCRRPTKSGGTCKRCHACLQLAGKNLTRRPRSATLEGPA